MRSIGGGIPKNLAAAATILIYRNGLFLGIMGDSQ